jgi:hypothetical protein
MKGKPLLYLLSLALTFVFVGFICTKEEEAPLGEFAAFPLTTEQTYVQLLKQMTRPDQVLHTTIHEESHSGDISVTATHQLWTDVVGDRARGEYEYSYTPKDMPAIDYSETRISSDGIEYVLNSDDSEVAKNRADICPGTTSTALHIQRICPKEISRSNASVSPITFQGEADFEGAPALVLSWQSAFEGSDQTTNTVSTLYLDATTILPIALISEGTIDAGEVRQFTATRRFTHEFVDANSLPADFFDPASIGYVAESVNQMLERIDPSLGLYWLGERFSPGAGLPDLALGDVWGGMSGPGYKGTLFYHPADDEFAPPMVVLELWELSDWQAFLAQSARHGNSWDSPCVQREEVQLAGGSATIFKSHYSNIAAFPPGPRPGEACPSGPFNDFYAHVYLGDTMIFVKSLRTAGPGNEIPNPFASENGIDIIIDSLQAR